MTKKSETNKMLSLMFHWDGVPPTMILDDSKEQTLGHFKRKPAIFDKLSHIPHGSKPQKNVSVSSNGVYPAR